MSNGIYDILGKLNGLQPKDNPVSMSAEPVYESIDPQDITPAVNSLEEKYQNFLAEEKSKKSQSQKDAEISRGEPEIVKLLNKARLERPSAASDTEALAYQMVKANKELEKANAANDEQETKIADLQTKITQLPTAKSVPAAQPISTTAPVAQQTAAPTPTPAARPSATILRMPTPAQAEIPAQAPATAEVPAQAPATAKVPAQAKPARTYKSAGERKPAIGGKVTPTLDQPVPDELAARRAARAAKVSVPNVSTFAPIGQAVGQQFTPINTKKESKSMKDMLKESIELVKEYREGDPMMGILNYNELLEKFKSGVQKITVNFGPGKNLTLYDYQVYGLLSELGSDQNEERKVARIETVMSDYNSVVNLLQTPKVKNYISLFPDFEKTSPIFKQRARDIEKGKFKLEPTTKKDPGEMPQQPHPYQQGDNQLEENLGKDTMQENVKTSSILQAVHQVEDKKLRESAKPDFLDLDKDGDTDEPMKSAAKSAKKHEPADVDKDAVAKRKRLQALKDKQEDERAEKGDDYKSSTRVVKGRAYGGAAQKDDEEKDLDESGLQYYTGKKKYGKEGMTALSKAGRDGASEEELGRIKDKYKKEDIDLNEKAVSKQQQKFMGMVHAVQKGKMKAPSKLIAKTAKSMSDKAAGDFAATKHKGLPTKVTEGKDAIRNHPIYTTKEAWDHYAEELAEQEMMEQSMMEAPAVDVQQELDEIAKLAGLAPKMEAKSVCPSCKCEKCECNENLDPMVPADSASPLTHTEEGMGCTMEELQEAMSRKDYRTMANKIKNMDDRDLAGEMCEKFAEMAKADNPRFKEEMFFAACGIDSPTSVLVDEETMDEGNEFTKARLDAIAQGKDTFSVSGKTYKVSGDTSDEKTQVESVNEDINVNITANGEQDALNLLRKLSGMAEVPQVTGIAIPMGDESSTCDACGSSPCGCEESVEEERDIELANTPHETVAPINAVTTDAGGGLGGPKKQYPLAANRGANPLEEEKLWTAYENMINDVKA
jgi:hypothetical protein